MIRLYGSPITRAQRVMWMLEELGIEYQQLGAVVPTQLEPQELVPHEELVELNPSGKVPILVDGDCVITESYAINLYLAKHYEGDLTPRSRQEWARAMQWTCWVATTIESDLNKAVGVRRGNILSALNEEQLQNDAIVRWALQVSLETMEAQLSRCPCLIDDRFTVADLNVAACLTLAPPAGVDMSGLPHVSKWLRQCLARPAAKTTWNTVLRDSHALGLFAEQSLPDEL